MQRKLRSLMKTRTHLILAVVSAALFCSLLLNIAQILRANSPQENTSSYSAFAYAAIARLVALRHLRSGNQDLAIAALETDLYQDAIRLRKLRDFSHIDKTTRDYAHKAYMMLGEYFVANPEMITVLPDTPVQMIPVDPLVPETINLRNFMEQYLMEYNKLVEQDAG